MRKRAQMEIREHKGKGGDMYRNKINKSAICGFFSSLRLVVNTGKKKSENDANQRKPVYFYA
jgi:hypothetical protein